jgi:DNA-binding transcriptional regulator LsrR (DeoR family)
VGVGGFAPDGSASSSLVRSGALSKADTRRLARLGAVGDLIVHPFSADGSFVGEDVAARAIAIGIDALRQVPTVIAVAGGPAKVEAIRGALATGVVRVLVTTAGTARALVA